MRHDLSKEYQVQLWIPIQGGFRGIASFANKTEAMVYASKFSGRALVWSRTAAMIVYRNWSK